MRPAPSGVNGLPKTGEVCNAWRLHCLDSLCPSSSLPSLPDQLLDWDLLDVQKALEEGASISNSSPVAFELKAAASLLLLLPFSFIFSDFCCCRKFFITVCRMIFWFLVCSALEGMFTLTVVTNCSGKWSPFSSRELSLMVASASSSILSAFLEYVPFQGVSSKNSNAFWKFRVGGMGMNMSVKYGWGLARRTIRHDARQGAAAAQPGRTVLNHS